MEGREKSQQTPRGKNDQYILGGNDVDLIF